MLFLWLTTRQGTVSEECSNEAGQKGLLSKCSTSCLKHGMSFTCRYTYTNVKHRWWATRPLPPPASTQHRHLIGNRSGNFPKQPTSWDLASYRRAHKLLQIRMVNYGHSKPKQLETHWQPDNRASWPVSMYNQ